MYKLSLSIANGAELDAVLAALFADAAEIGTSITDTIAIEVAE